MSGVRRLRPSAERKRNGRFTSGPAVGSAQRAVVRYRRGERGKIDSERPLPLDFVEQRSEESSVKAQIVDTY